MLSAFLRIRLAIRTVAPSLQNTGKIASSNNKAQGNTLVAEHANTVTEAPGRETVRGFLLSRHWRDKRERFKSGPEPGNGCIDLGFWAATADLPLYLSVPAQQAICFVERSYQPEPQERELLEPAERKPLELTVMDGGAADGIYFPTQRQLNDARAMMPALCESDVKPTDRYLMERFINAGFSATGQVIKRQGYLEMVHPQLKPDHYIPNLNAISLDIETRAATSEIYSIAACGAETAIVFMVAPDRIDQDSPGNSNDSTRGPDTPHPQKRKLKLEHKGTEIEYDLVYLDSETTVLEAFFSWIRESDPDVLIGWNVVNFDLAVLHRRAEQLGVRFDLARGREQATVLQPTRNASGNTTGQRVARIPGRAVLDGVDLLRAGFWAFESFSLDNVSSELLGTRKLITGDIDKVAEINRLYRDDKPSLADYNLLDCVLVQDIFEHADLLAFAHQRAAITGLAIDRMGGAVAAFDHLYLPRLHRQGYVARDIVGRNAGGASPGGYVMDSVPGLYENVLVLDFKSLYPSIIRTFLIDPLGLSVALASTTETAAAGDPQPANEPGKPLGDQTSEAPVEGFENALFSRNQHILPGLIENLWERRDEAKRDNNRALSQAIKIIMNSFYGVLGSSGCRFHNQQLASSITRRGHEIITRSRDFIEEKGYRVIYGDTDSLFVLLGEGIDPANAKATGKDLMETLNTWWSETLMDEHQLESALEVEFETHYIKFLMPTVRGMATGSKKRYAGMVASPGRPDGQQPGESGDEESGDELTLVFKGLEAVRTDWTPLARNFQRELYRRIFQKEPFEEFVRDTAKALLDGECDDQLVYRKRLRRRLADYQRNVPPHVQAARKQAKTGSWVSYIITKQGPEPLDALSTPPDYEHYLERQLAPAADGILYFLDTSFKAINDGQMRMF